MKNLKDAKEIYDHIVIPEELDIRLKETLESAETSKVTKGKVVNFRKWTAAAASGTPLFSQTGWAWRS